VLEVRQQYLGRTPPNRKRPSQNCRSRTVNTQPQKHN